MKKEYFELIIEIRCFDDNDVITASTEFELEDDPLFN